MGGSFSLIQITRKLDTWSYMYIHVYILSMYRPLNGLVNKLHYLICYVSDHTVCEVVPTFLLRRQRSNSVSVY